jgi:hypothetical protein
MQCRQRAGDGGSRVGNIERKSFPSRELNAGLPLSEPLPNVSGKAAQREGFAKRLVIPGSGVVPRVIMLVPVFGTGFFINLNFFGG